MDFYQMLGIRMEAQTELVGILEDFGFTVDFVSGMKVWYFECCRCEKKRELQSCDSLGDIVVWAIAHFGAHDRAGEITE